MLFRSFKHEDAKGMMRMAEELQVLQSLRETAIVLVSVGKGMQPQMFEEARRLGFQKIVAYDEIM